MSIVYDITKYALRHDNTGWKTVKKRTATCGITYFSSRPRVCNLPQLFAFTDNYPVNDSRYILDSKEHAENSSILRYFNSIISRMCCM